MWSLGPTKMDGSINLSCFEVEVGKYHFSSQFTSSTVKFLAIKKLPVIHSVL